MRVIKKPAEPVPPPPSTYDIVGLTEDEYWVDHTAFAAGHDLDRAEAEYKAKIEQMQRSGQRETISSGKRRGKARAE